MSDLKDYTKDEALSLLREYSDLARDRAKDTEGLFYSAGEALRSVAGMRARFPEEGSKSKARHWVGFAQGVLVTCGAFTLEQVIDHSRNKTIYSRKADSRGPL